MLNFFTMNSAPLFLALSLRYVYVVVNSGKSGDRRDDRRNGTLHTAVNL